MTVAAGTARAARTGCASVSMGMGIGMRART